MNKKIMELRRKLTAKLQEARELIDAGKVEEGQNATKEATAAANIAGLNFIFILLSKNAYSLCIILFKNL